MKDPAEDLVLRRLRDEAARLRGESYPGNVLDDIRARLIAAPSRRARGSWAFAALAAALLVALLLRSERSRENPPAIPSLSASLRTLSLSPWPARPPGEAPRLRLGPALSLGSRALSAVKPPVRPRPDSKEEP